MEDVRENPYIPEEFKKMLDESEAREQAPSKLNDDPPMGLKDKPKGRFVFQESRRMGGRRR